MEICGERVEPNDLLWVAMEGDELCAAAIAWLSTDGECEVKLMGGRDHRRWLGLMSETIGNAAKDAGAYKLVAIGRAGWRRIAALHGWEECHPVGKLWMFERKL